MNPSEIYQELQKRNLNIAMIAEALGVSSQAVYSVVRKGESSRRIAQAVAVAIDCPLEKVFPYYARRAQSKTGRAEKVAELKQRFSEL